MLKRVLWMIGCGWMLFAGLGCEGAEEPFVSEEEGGGTDSTCTPGESFPSDDGCNTCGCPESGLKSEAACTEMACTPTCETDGDCGDDNLSCQEGVCAPIDPEKCIPGTTFTAACNECQCPESGLKSEAGCTELDCPVCVTDADCVAYAYAASCFDNILYPGSGPMTCEPYPGGNFSVCKSALTTAQPIDCAESEEVCVAGECVPDEPEECIVGESGCEMILEEPEVCWDGSTVQKECLDLGTGCGWVVTQACPSNPCDEVDCGEGATPPVCDGDIAIPGTAPQCNPETGMCETTPNGEEKDCGAMGLNCIDGECVAIDPASCAPGESFLADDGCNTCSCPESGLKDEAFCTQMGCGPMCVLDEDCGGGATSSWCDGEIAKSGSVPACNPETGMCENKAYGEDIDCAAEGLSCLNGECVDMDPNTCTPGEAFPAGDGCNTCSCPDSGLKFEALCTLMACGPECVEDFDCGVGATPPTCDGDLAIPSSAPGCNKETGQCEMQPIGDVIDCAEQGLACANGKCQ